MQRRTFLGRLTGWGAGLLALAGGGVWWWQQKQPKSHFSGKLLGPDFKAGHRLRGKLIFSKPSLTEYYDCIIVGGGVSGLSAARWLQKNGMDNFRLLELENHIGGNAFSGENQFGKYPFGAHYLPVPNLNLKELLAFLEENKILTGYDEKGLPVFDETYLCAEPEERLYINGTWQEGLIPHFGVTDADKKQIDAFLAKIEEFRLATGTDGKPAFAIPIDNSSEDEKYRQLDNINMLQWLEKEGLKSDCVKWYAEYGCRDDYGTNLQHTSAWAGIHYFAARKAKAANAESHDVLTWSEGNHFLVKLLESSVKEKCLTGKMVYEVKLAGEEVWIHWIDIVSGKTGRYIAKTCIMATPQFINQRLLPVSTQRDTDFYKQFTYSSWIVANITVKGMGIEPGKPLSWDNVFYDSHSLGYVDASHQHFSLLTKERVLTYYYPLTATDSITARKTAYTNDWQQWRKVILEDLSKVHPWIEDEIISMDIWVWGHAMICPVPGFIWNKQRQQFGKSMDNKIFFAHTDLSGISIFEEAFYAGVRVGKSVVESVNV
jgi:hypothetical protein